MDFFSQQQNGKVLIKFPQRIDFNQLPMFRDEYESHGRTTQFVIDFCDVTALNCSSLGLLLHLRDYTAKTKDKIALVNCNDEVKSIFNVSNFSKLFDII